MPNKRPLTIVDQAPQMDVIAESLDAENDQKPKLQMEIMIPSEEVTELQSQEVEYAEACAR